MFKLFYILSIFVMTFYELTIFMFSCVQCLAEVAAGENIVHLHKTCGPDILLHTQTCFDPC